MIGSIIQVVLLLGAIQGLIMSLLLLSWKANKVANFYLALLIIAISIQSLLMGYGDSAFYLDHPHLSRIAWVLPTLFPPLLFLYVKKLTETEARFTLNEHWHFIPFAAYLFYLSPYFFLDASAKRSIIASPAFDGEAFYMDELKLIQGIVYSAACLFVLKEFDKRLKDHYSDIEKLRLSWLHQFLYYFIILWLIALITVQLSSFWRFDMEPVLFVYVFTVIGIYLLSYKSLLQPQLFQHTSPGTRFSPQAIEVVTPPIKQTSAINAAAQEAESSSKQKYQRSTLLPEQAQQYEQDLVTYMNSQKPFLDSTLTLQDLSAGVDLSTHHLSQVINDRFKQNFYDFINSYRVEEAKRLLTHKDYRNLTNLAVAYDSGFNSKTTFNVAFKKNTGVTPSDYAKLNKS